MVDSITARISPKVIARQVRKQVSRDRHRFVDDEYDLDLSYITDNIIAMGIPSSGIQSLWRNSIDESAAMLKKYHDDHFMICKRNLSGLNYNYEKFNHQILDFGFPDHHSPPLEMLFKIVFSMKSFLSENSSNVAVAHCVGGKGRTGTVIACYLIYSGQFKETVEALQWFAQKRSSISKGVIQPSQIRYTKYFGDIINRRVTVDFRNCLMLKYVELSPPPLWSKKKKGCYPILRIYSAHHYPKKLLYSSDANKAPVRFYSCAEPSVLWEPNVVVQSDILVIGCKLTEKKPKKMFRYSFHTAFHREGEVVLTAQDLDPAQGGKKFHKWFTEDFQVKLTFVAPPQKLAKIQNTLYPSDAQVKNYLSSINEEAVNKKEDWGEVTDVIRNSMQLPLRSKTAPAPAPVSRTTSAKDDVREIMRMSTYSKQRSITSPSRKSNRFSYIGMARENSRKSLEEKGEEPQSAPPLPSSPPPISSSPPPLPTTPPPVKVNTSESEEMLPIEESNVTTADGDPVSATDSSHPLTLADPLTVEAKEGKEEIEENLEDYDFLESLQSLLEQREEKKRETFHQFHLRLQQQQRKSMERKAKRDGERPVQLGMNNFGML